MILKGKVFWLLEDNRMVNGVLFYMWFHGVPYVL